MITTALIQIIGGVVSGLFSIFPTWGVDTSAVTNMTGISTSLGSLNGWVPEQLIFICALIAVGVRLFFLAWSGVLFLYRLIPFNG